MAALLSLVVAMVVTIGRSVAGLSVGLSVGRSSNRSGGRVEPCVVGCVSCLLGQVGSIRSGSGWGLDTDPGSRCGAGGQRSGLVRIPAGSRSRWFHQVKS